MSLRILIAEDNYTLRRLYMKGLENLDIDIIEAGSAKDTMKLIAAESFDVMICDIEMGDGTNFETIDEAVKQGITVIAISAYENYEPECIQRGAVTFLQKPFPTRALARAVQDQLSASANGTL
ncbi:MAG: response regulator [Chloroflexota bacterium]